MKEKICKKGITRRLLSVVLTLAMVLSLLPLNGTLVYAAEPELGETINSSSGAEVSGTDFKVISTYYAYNEWRIGGSQNGTITVSRTDSNTTKNIGKLVFNSTDVASDDEAPYVATDNFTVCDGATVEYDGVDKLTISGLNTSSITIGYNDSSVAFCPDSVEIYYVDAPAPSWVADIISKVDAASTTLVEEGYGGTETTLADSELGIGFANFCGQLVSPSYSVDGNVYTINGAEGGTSRSYTFNVTLDEDGNVAKVEWIQLVRGIPFFIHTYAPKQSSVSLTATKVEFGTSMGDTPADWNYYLDIAQTAGDGLPSVTQIKFNNCGFYDVLSMVDGTNSIFNNETGALKESSTLSNIDIEINGVATVNPTSMTFTVAGYGTEWQPLTMEVEFSYNSEDYVLAYTAHKITYTQPKSSGSSEYETIDVDVFAPNVNTTKGVTTPGNAPSGKEFTGWTTTKNGTSGYSFGSPLTENIELYPIWGDHTHTWGYTADDNVITATCTKNSDHTATLTLSASSANYSGSAVEATMDKTAWEAAGLTAPSIVYEAKTGSALTEGKAKNVGSYTAKISVGDPAETASVDFDIHGASTTYASDDTNHWFTCAISGCTDTAETHKFNKAAHSYDATSHKCVCGKIDPTYHQHVLGTKHNAVAGTCTTAGTLEYYDCAGTLGGVCGKKLDASGNELTSITGTKDSSNHAGTATTWTKTATTHKETYDCCGVVKTAEGAHTYGAWTVTKLATATAAGKKEHSCTVCAYKETVATSYEKPADDTAVDPDAGKIENTTDSSKNDCAANVEITKSEIIEKLDLTPEELSRVENGENISVYLEVKAEEPKNIPQAEKKEAEKKLESGEKIGQYLDINLFKVVGNDKNKVSQTKGKIKIEITIPSDIKKVGTDYFVIRVHDGVATKLELTLVSGDTYSFETDQFSTYAIGYKAVSTNTNEEKEPENKQENTAPATGDANDVMYWFIIMMLSLGTIGLMMLKGKKEES